MMWDFLHEQASWSKPMTNHVSFTLITLQEGEEWGGNVGHLKKILRNDSHKTLKHTHTLHHKCIRLLTTIKTVWCASLRILSSSCRVVQHSWRLHDRRWNEKTEGYCKDQTGKRKRLQALIKKVRLLDELCVLERKAASAKAEGNSWHAKHHQKLTLDGATVRCSLRGKRVWANSCFTSEVSWLACHSSVVDLSAQGVNSSIFLEEEWM